MVLLRPIQKLKLLMLLLGPGPCACCCRRGLAAPVMVGMKAKPAASRRRSCCADIAGGPGALMAAAAAWRAVEARSSAIKIGTAGWSACRRCAAAAAARLRVPLLLLLLLLLLVPRRRCTRPVAGNDGRSRIQRMPAASRFRPVWGGWRGFVRFWSMSVECMCVMMMHPRQPSIMRFRERARGRRVNGPRTETHDHAYPKQFMHSSHATPINSQSIAPAWSTDRLIDFD